MIRQRATDPETTLRKRRRYNRDLQRTYRTRHAEELRQAKQVLLALMALRTRSVREREWMMETVAERLRGFLTEAEIARLLPLLDPATRAAQRRSNDKQIRKATQRWLNQIRTKEGTR